MDTVNSTIRIPSELNAALVTQAKLERRTRQAQILYILGKYIDEHNASHHSELFKKKRKTPIAQTA